jgi:6-phosphogluconolactonase
MASIRILGCLAAACVATTACAAEPFVWFGTYTHAGVKGGSKGIYVSRFDDETGELSAPELAATARSPSFLARHPTLPVLYAVSEVVDAEGTTVGSVQAFAIDRATGRLTVKNHRPSGGEGPCHVAVDPGGRVALAANYGGGSAICLGIDSDGGLEPVAPGNPGGFLQHVLDRSADPGVDPGRQAKPRGHSIDAVADGRFAIVCDLGLDTVFVHALDAARATLAPHGSAAVKAGAGPRHFAMHPNGRFGYCVNELDLTVTAFAFDSQAGALTVIQTLPTLPAGVTDRRGFSTAEIAVHPSGKFLYASNRGHDSIAAYAVDAATGRLTFLGVEPARVKTPRHFAIAPGGRFLLAAGQDSGTVAVLAIDGDTGRLSPTGKSIAVPACVCICFQARGE